MLDEDIATSATYRFPLSVPILRTFQFYPQGTSATIRTPGLEQVSSNAILRRMALLKAFPVFNRVQNDVCYIISHGTATIRPIQELT